MLGIIDDQRIMDEVRLNSINEEEKGTLNDSVAILPWQAERRLRNTHVFDDLNTIVVPHLRQIEKKICKAIKLTEHLRPSVELAK